MRDTVPASRPTELPSLATLDCVEEDQFQHQERESCTEEADQTTPGRWVNFKQGIYYTCLVSGGLFLPYALINAILCFKGWVVPRRQAAAGAMLNVALNNGMTPALEMQPQEASCPQEQ